MVAPKLTVLEALTESAAITGPSQFSPMELQEVLLDSFSLASHCILNAIFGPSAKGHGDGCGEADSQVLVEPWVSGSF